MDSPVKLFISDQYNINLQFQDYNANCINVKKLHIYEILGARGGEYCGPAWHSQYSNSEQSGDQLLVGVRYSVPIQTGPGAHPASYTMCTRLFPGVKQLGLGVAHPPPSRAEVKKTRAPLPDLHGGEY